MNYIIFDLEWNYGTDDEQGIGEIIELGAVKLNSDFAPIDELRLYIKPHLYPKLHARISALTGIKDKHLQEQGIPFPEAYAQFTNWCGQDCLWMTWSTSDLPILVDNLHLHGLDADTFPDYCDLQRIFSREIMRSDTQYSLETALAVLKEKGETAHDALHDACNTAKICARMDLDSYIGEYTGRFFGLPPMQAQYESRRDMLSDPALQHFACPWCGQDVVCESWIHFGHSTHISYGICPEEDEFWVQLFPTAHRRDSFTAKRLVFELTDDLWDIYLNKKEAAQGVTP